MLSRSLPKYLRHFHTNFWNYVKKWPALNQLPVAVMLITLSSQASSRMSSASMETVLLWSCSWVTSNSIPQLLKNSTLARSSTRRCLVAYRRQFCSRTHRENHSITPSHQSEFKYTVRIHLKGFFFFLHESYTMDITVIWHITNLVFH